MTRTLAIPRFAGVPALRIAFAVAVGANNAAAAETLDAGATSAPYAFVPLAGTRELRGVHQGNASPEWSLGKDCDGVAVFGVVLGAQDTGGRDITRKLVAARAGSCTITATILGVTATKTVRVR